MSIRHKIIGLIFSYAIFGVIACKEPTEIVRESITPTSPPFTIIGIVPVTMESDPVPPIISDEITVGIYDVIPSASLTAIKNEALLAATNLEAEFDYNSIGVKPFSQSVGALDLGMNNVPVLDQGQYGTCVTFATTAAMDAILGKGNFISQQYTLELTKALGSNLWNGAYNALQILNPLKTYGLVQQGKYAPQYPNPNASTTIPAYLKLTDKIITAKRIIGKYIYPLSLSTLKNALRNKHRVAIGFGLLNTNDPISVGGFNMKISGKTTKYGLWACKQPSSPTNYCSSIRAGHEVVVIGYDDKQQLLKIRNSWNTGVGEAGNFYMTYDFFQKMIFDGTELY